MEGDLEIVLPELLLRLRGRGGVAVSVVGSELLASKNELRFCSVLVLPPWGASMLWWKLEAVGERDGVELVGEEGRDEADGGRRKAVLVSPRCSYSFVMDLTERLCDKGDGLLLCNGSIEVCESNLFELGACPLSGRLARRESERIRSPAIVFVVLVVVVAW